MHVYIYTNIYIYIYIIQIQISITCKSFKQPRVAFKQIEESIAVLKKGKKMLKTLFNKLA